MIAVGGESEKKAAWFKNAPDLAHKGPRIAHMLQHVNAEHCIETTSIEWERSWFGDNRGIEQGIIRNTFVEIHPDNIAYVPFQVITVISSGAGADVKHGLAATNVFV